MCNKNLNWTIRTLQTRIPKHVVANQFHIRNSAYCAYNTDTSRQELFMVKDILDNATSIVRPIYCLCVDGGNEAKSEGTK